MAADNSQSSTQNDAAGDYVDQIQRGPPLDQSPLDISISATVVKGFGRGSKLLGIPTANMDMNEISSIVNPLETGIYYGFTKLGEVVYEAVISVGVNPYFQNEQKTVEPHLLHDFGTEDFYGQRLHLRLVGYVRPELNFNTLDDLIRAIRGDIEHAKSRLSAGHMQAIADELHRTDFTQHPLNGEQQKDDSAA